MTGKGTCRYNTTIKFSELIEGLTWEGLARVTVNLSGEFYYQAEKITADPYYSEPEYMEIENAVVEDYPVIIIEECSCLQKPELEPTNSLCEEITSRIIDSDTIAEEIAEEATCEGDWDFQEDGDDYAEYLAESKWEEEQLRRHCCD